MEMIQDLLNPTADNLVRVWQCVRDGGGLPAAAGNYLAQNPNGGKTLAAAFCNHTGVRRRSDTNLPTCASASTAARYWTVLFKKLNLPFLCFRDLNALLRLTY